MNGTVTRGGGGPKIRKFCKRNKWMPPKELSVNLSIVDFSHVGVINLEIINVDP